MPIRFSFFVRAMAYIAFAFAASAQDTQSIECPSAAPPTQQLTEGEIRARALQALGCNVTKYKNILYDAEDRTEFTGHAGGGMSLDGPAPEVKTWTPALRSHFEIVNGKPTNVLDGWED